MTAPRSWRGPDDACVEEEARSNEPGRVFVARRARSELTTTILSSAQVRDLVEKMLKSSGWRIHIEQPVRTTESTRARGAR